MPATSAENANKPSPAIRHKHITLPLDEVHKRIEQDRERHKRLRERRWVQRISHTNNLAAPTPQLASFYSLTEAIGGQEELAMDIEFENEWETTSDWNEDDDEAISEEAQLAFPDDDGRLRGEPYEARAMAHQRTR
jgi:CTD kinase subunit gamma